MHKKARIAVFLSIAGNILIFILKLFIGIFSNSIAVMSDAIHQLADIFDSVIMFYCVKISYKGADEGHHYGHQRAQPIAALVTSIIIGVAGFEIIKSAFERFFYGSAEIVFNQYFILLLILTILMKISMTIYFTKVGRETNSPAIAADAIESRNEIFITSFSVLSLILSRYDYQKYDSLIGFLMGLLVLYSSYKILKENVDYLMGHSPSGALLNEIKSLALSVKEVKGLNDVKAHYVGNVLHVEIHIEVDEDLSIKKAHDIGKIVEKKIESLGYVTEAFVHIDPM